jgi:predicted branched-subunit amino acid permease
MKRLELAVTTAQKRAQFDFRMLGHNLAAYLNWLLANMAGGSLRQWISNPEKYMGLISP